MITVDQIRQEMEKTGDLPRRTSGRRRRDKMGQRKGAKKEMRPLPDEITSRWIWSARCAELIEVLRKRYDVVEDLTDVGVMDLRKMVLSKNPMTKPGPKVNKSAGSRKPAKLDNTGQNRVRSAKSQPPETGISIPRLVLAETFPCPACGAQLMIQGR